MPITLPKRFFFFFFFLFFIASHVATLGGNGFAQLAASPEHRRRPAPRCLEHCPAQPARDRASAAELVPRCRAECAECQALRASAAAAGHCSAVRAPRRQCNIGAQMLLWTRLMHWDAQCETHYTRCLPAAASSVRHCRCTARLARARAGHAPRFDREPVPRPAERVRAREAGRAPCLPHTQNARTETAAYPLPKQPQHCSACI